MGKRGKTTLQKEKGREWEGNWLNEPSRYGKEKERGGPMGRKKGGVSLTGRCERREPGFQGRKEKRTRGNKLSEGKKKGKTKVGEPEEKNETVGTCGAEEGEVAWAWEKY